MKDGRKCQQHPQNWGHLIFPKEYEQGPSDLALQMWTCGHLCQKAASPQCKSSCRSTCALWVKHAKEADENTGFCTTQFTALADPCILFWLRFKLPILIYRIFIVPGLSYVKTYIQEHLSMQVHSQKKPHPGILSLLKLQEQGEQVPCGS